jgi:hypothetical protein
MAKNTNELKSWHLVVKPRKEVREGRSFNPDEFAIHLEQVVKGNAPEDYKDPAKFFARTFFTRALREHSGMVLRRLAGGTNNTAPVLTLVTAFGGGKTHTLTTLYHLANNADKAHEFVGVSDLLREEKVSAAPKAKVATFVGNAWDPQPGYETPWIDLARQLAGDKGVALLGKSAETVPPGTEVLNKIFEEAGGTVLVLFDEVLNFINRHRKLADPFYAFIQNLTVAMTGTTRSAAVISLPRSQVEMTQFDIDWQDKISKVVSRVAKNLIANDEGEISEVIRRRLFEDLGDIKTRRTVAKAYTDWCFERTERLPSEWVSVDTATSNAKARERLMQRFESCYPFHPATLSVFQRKWQTLSHFQQTRSTLAMFAQWISWAYKDSFTQARQEPLITIGSAPLDVNDFRSMVLGQLHEPRLDAAIQTDISGEHSHARTLDADLKNELMDLHRRVGTAIMFESTGGQADKTAHLPELRFALGDPNLDTTSIDNAAHTLESRAFYIRKYGTDAYRIRHQPTLKKVMNDRRASLDDDLDIKPTMRKLVQGEFEKGRSLPMVFFPKDSSEIADSPRLTIIVLDPETEWTGNGNLSQRIAEWTRQRSKSQRLYPGALVWCVKKPGRDLKVKTERWLAWRKVKSDMETGALGHDFDQSELHEIEPEFRDAQSDAKEEVWACYRYIILADSQDPSGLRVIDLGAGHSGGGATLAGRIIEAMKAESLLNESVGAGYTERNWPPALKESGAWSLASFRKSFLDGSLTRLIDPEIMRNKIVEFVAKGDFGLASGRQPDGDYNRIWFNEPISPDEITFDADVYLLQKFKAAELKMKAQRGKAEPSESPANQPALNPDVFGVPGGENKPQPITTPTETSATGSQPESAKPASQTIHLSGNIPSEVWNRLGTKIIPKLKSAGDLQIGLEFTVTVSSDAAPTLQTELRQILDDLGLEGKVRVEVR